MKTTHRLAPRLRYLILLSVLAGLVLPSWIGVPPTSAAEVPGCMNGGFLVVFLRGTNGTLNRSGEYERFTSGLTSSFGDTARVVEIGDQDGNGQIDVPGYSYPAIGLLSLPDYVTSVALGVKELTELLNYRAATLKLYKFKSLRRPAHAVCGADRRQRRQ
ncbi:MAG TPA: hypothetical protein VLA77_02440 [Candidatus Saccharimonadales bacterium]|nr:hypothetical protein [Candidatus Saccharimonadales bacterium]